MYRKKVFLTLIVLLILPFFLTAEAKHILTVDLLLEWETVSSPKISPDGKHIVYTKKWVDKMNDKLV